MGQWTAGRAVCTTDKRGAQTVDVAARPRRGAFAGTWSLCGRRTVAVRSPYGHLTVAVRSPLGEQSIYACVCNIEKREICMLTFDSLEVLCFPSGDRTATVRRSDGDRTATVRRPTGVHLIRPGTLQQPSPTLQAARGWHPITEVRAPNNPSKQKHAQMWRATRSTVLAQFSPSSRPVLTTYLRGI